MLWLAQIISKSRINTCLCAVLGFGIPLLAPATVGLTALTKHFWEAVLVILWALLLPMIALDSNVDINALLKVIIIAALVNTLVSSQILKYSRSWALALISISLLAAVAGLVTPALVDVTTIIQQAQQHIDELIAKQITTSADGKSVSIDLDINDIQALTAYTVAIQAALALLVARWWQSELYHQGAFGNEIRALRLDYRLGLILVIIFVTLLLANNASIAWQLTVLLPLVFSGCALIHWYNSHSQKLNSGLIALLYVALFVWEFSLYIVASLALFDSFIDCRKKWLKIN